MPTLLLVLAVWAAASLLAAGAFCMLFTGVRVLALRATHPPGRGRAPGLAPSTTPLPDSFAHRRPADGLSRLPGD